MTRAFALILALGLAMAGPAKAQPPIWIVRDADSEIVLFGSVHVLPPGIDWGQARLDPWLKTADDLWFELPVDAATEAETGRIAAARGVLPAGASLSSMLSPPARARMARLAPAYGISLEQLDRLEPWFAEVVLAGQAYRKAAASAGAGVEQTISRRAPPRLARRAFETPDLQIALFDEAPLAVQIASLEDTLKEMERDPKAYEGLVAAWQKPDLKSLEREAIAPMRRVSPVLYQRLLADRNAAWTRTLDQRLKGKGRTVVVVGIGHLIGKDGVPARLRGLGYSVEGP
jgi:hypothetical protein